MGWRIQKIELNISQYTSEYVSGEGCIFCEPSCKKSIGLLFSQGV